MNREAWANIVVEGILDEVVFRRVAELSSPDFRIAIPLGKKGKSYIRDNIEGFNNASRGFPHVILVDLNNEYSCAPDLIRGWLSSYGRHLYLRIAVREIEAWLFADRVNFSKFLGVPLSRIPSDPEGIINPKDYLINLARGSSKKVIKGDIPPDLRSTAKIGKNYNGRLAKLVNEGWDIDIARVNSKSLDRFIVTLQRFGGEGRLN
jgi:hypothetical protein